MDVLNLYFLKFSIFYALLYKILNPRGILHLKLDLDVYSNRALERKWYNNFRLLVFQQYLRHIPTFVSAESTESVSYIRDKYKIDYPKLLHIPNWIDNKLIEELGICIRPFQEKENLIISVQRVGSYQKNSEVILDA